MRYISGVKESIKKKITNTFESNPLPMHGGIMRKQIVETKSHQYRKTKQMQLQSFQHKTGKLNIIEMHKTMFPSLIITFTSTLNKVDNITIKGNNSIIRMSILTITKKRSKVINWINRSKLFHPEIFIRQAVFTRSFSKFGKVKLIIISIKLSQNFFLLTINNRSTSVQERSTKNDRTSFASC